jgi:hypothetical protein
MLQTIWVKVFDVPSNARNEPDLKEISITFGGPSAIDTKSLPGLGPIRVQVDCKDPTKLRGRIEIFLNKAGFKFRMKQKGLCGHFLRYLSPIFRGMAMFLVSGEIPMIVLMNHGTDIGSKTKRNLKLVAQNMKGVILIGNIRLLIITFLPFPQLVLVISDEFVPWAMSKVMNLGFGKDNARKFRERDGT